MDKMDKLLHELPGHEPSMKLASQIRQTVHRRLRRRRIARNIAASVLIISGLWLSLPALSSLSLSDLFDSGTPWLVTGLNTLNLETISMLTQLWNGMFSLQSAIDSSLVVSIWIGILLLCFGIFFAVDMQTFQTPIQSYKKG